MLTPLIVASLGAALFLSTWTHAVQVADSGELITAACRAGVAHPPGFPLYILLGHALCHLPWSTPAGRVGLLSILAGIWALLAVYALVNRLTGNKWAAGAAALSLATGSIFWYYASISEVFSLNAALSLTLLYVALRASSATASRDHAIWSTLTGLAAGLALCNHHSSVLVFPVALLAVVRPWRSLIQALGRGISALIGFTLGVLPYGYLLLADPLRLPRWGEPSTGPGLLHHVLRRDYGTFSLALGGKAAPLDNLAHYLKLVPSQLGWILWPLALLGGFALLYQAIGRMGVGITPTRARRDLAAAIAFLPLLAGPGFLLLFNINPQGIGAQVVERFYLLPNALLTICLGVGLAIADASWLSGNQRFPRAYLWRHSVWLVIACAAIFSFNRANASTNYVVEDYAYNALQTVEKDGLVLGVGDVQGFSLLYAQQMLGLRPDVQYVDVRLLLYPWYVAQKRRERPAFSYRYQPGKVDTVRLIQREMERGVAVYLAVVYSQKVQRSFAGYPVGPLFRLLPPGKLPPSPPEVNRINQHLFHSFLRRGRLPNEQKDPWSASLLEPYAQTWRSIAQALDQIGERQAALQALARAKNWAPWLPLFTGFK